MATGNIGIGLLLLIGHCLNIVISLGFAIYNVYNENYFSICLVVIICYLIYFVLKKIELRYD